MFFRLLLIFTTIPLIEIWLLLKISQHIGILDTIVLVVVTGVTGAWLAKSQGLHVWRNIQSELQQNRMPSDAMLEGLLLLIGGIVLLTPGLLTDMFGLLLLLPFTRKWIIIQVKNRFRQRFQVHNVYQNDDTFFHYN